MKICIVRHGESTGNAAAALGLPDHSSDPELTDLGRHQAELLGAWPVWDEIAPTRVFTSLLSRTIQTAAPLAERLDLPIEAKLDLFECGGPAQAPWDAPVPHPGSPRSHLDGLSTRVRLPEEASESGWFAGPLEAPHVSMTRALSAAAWLAELDEPSVAVICHGAFGAMLLNALLAPQELARAASDEWSGAEDQPLVFSLENTSTSLLDVAAGRRARVAWINRVDHLVSDLGSKVPWLGEPWPPRPVRQAS